MQKGRFISFEGSEGCGKSTQIRILLDLLEKKGIAVLLTREPGGTVVGERIRDLLQYTPEAKGMTAEAELLLFAASRAQLVREVIAPALQQGQWVIADRFLDSTTVYQGLGRGLDQQAVAHINDFAVGEVKPDLTLLLDMDAQQGHARAKAVSEAEGKFDRMEDQELDFFERVRQGYLNLADIENERISIVDASKSIEEVSASIEGIIKKRYHEFSA
ncbi:MAG: dTMP kinase [Verrucomicrobiales bacterium]|nr:dTMP kinase [Verrucomicrobiales bacterium]